MKKMYKAGKPRFSYFYEYEVCDIYKRKNIFGFIPVWSLHDTIKNTGQVEEVVFLLNNPEELKARLDVALFNLQMSIK